MANMKFCRLCGSTSLAVLETIPAQKLKSCYAFDTSQFFPEADVTLLGCLDCGLRLFDQAVPGDAEFYDRLQAIPSYYEDDKAEFEHALSTIAATKPASVLDVGAGCGLFLRKLLRMPSLRVRASELSEKSLASLTQAGIAIDSADERYDFVCSFQVFEHIADLRAIMSFVDGKLVPGGHLLVSVPNPDCPLFRETFAYLDYPPHHMNRFTKLALESLGRILGYSPIDYWQEPLRIEHFSSVVKGRRRKMLAAGRFRWLQQRLGGLTDVLLLPALHRRSGEIGHSHTMVYRKPA
jgi:SAM-dependent methyltransferase